MRPYLTFALVCLSGIAILLGRTPAARGDSGHDPIGFSRFGWMQLQLTLEQYHPCRAMQDMPPPLSFEKKGYAYIFRLSFPNPTTITIVVRAATNPKALNVKEAKAKAVDEIKKSLISCKDRLLKYQNEFHWSWLQINSDLKYVNAYDDLHL